MKTQTLAEFLQSTEQGKRGIVYREMSSDRLTPINIVESLRKEMQTGALLESGLQHDTRGRYTFIGLSPAASLQIDHEKTLYCIDGAQKVLPVAHPIEALRQFANEFKCSGNKDDLKLCSPIIGHMNYEAIHLLEDIPRNKEPDLFPCIYFKFYRTHLLFDHVSQILRISLIVDLTQNREQLFYTSQEKINQLITQIKPKQSVQPSPPSFPKNSSPSVDININDEQFMLLVEQAKRYIIAGDAFQIVLSRKFTQSYDQKPFDIYRALRQISPAPYMFYLPTEHGTLIGASPEKMISVVEGRVEINPIAGTRPRSLNMPDKQIEEELLNDPKERAEHMMLVDLARNDLGAVCEAGSIQIDHLLQVKHFSHVSHMTSTVSGKLCGDKDIFDALASSFPAGTLSGAPKIRAMQIIAELETAPRGLYGGVICRLDGAGNLDSCIAIRMAIVHAGKAVVQTGAGIVFDSTPQAEADETRHKAQGLLRAIQLAEAGLE